MSDDTPDARERAEAEALARALDGEPAPDAPADALEAAALLKHARADRLSAERLAAVEFLRRQFVGSGARLRRVLRVTTRPAR